MVDTQPVADFLPWNPGKHGITAEPRGPEGKPRTGRQDAGGNGAGLDEFSQARLDENPVLGLYRARI